jgi:hypothetical protein
MGRGIPSSEVEVQLMHHAGRAPQLNLETYRMRGCSGRCGGYLPSQGYAAAKARMARHACP